MMEIISHRGYWKNTEEKNQLVSFKRSFSNGYGTETDLRDCDGEIVIAHDMPVKSRKNISLDEFLELYKNYNIDNTLALNIKSDGLQELLKVKLLQYDIRNYFVFDMSIPDTRGYIRNGLTFFVRLSELENKIVFSDCTSGVWLDAFDGLWYNRHTITEILQLDKKVAIVSFELHRRNHLHHWKWIKENNLHMQKNVILCTDLPDQANTFFFTQTI